MIARLRGILEEKSKEQVVLDVQGVGYGLLVPETVLHKLPEIGELVSLQVYTHVREDQISLFGFLTHLERDVFLILLSANGVGPKLANTILSALEAEQILEAVTQGNKAMFSGISGVGKKTVEKLLIEIREKCEKKILEIRGDSTNSRGVRSGASGAKSVDISSGTTLWARDLEQALHALGFSESDSRLALRETLKHGAELTSFELALKYALKLLNSGHDSSRMRGTA